MSARKIPGSRKGGAARCVGSPHPFSSRPRVQSSRPRLGYRKKSSQSLHWSALQPGPAPSTGRVAGTLAPRCPVSLRRRVGRRTRWRRGARGGERGEERAGVRVRTEETVVLPGALHAAVRQDLQVEAGAAVELPAAQDAVQVRQLRSPGPAAGAPLRRA